MDSKLYFNKTGVVVGYSAVTEVKNNNVTTEFIVESGEVTKDVAIVLPELVSEQVVIGCTKSELKGVLLDEPLQSNMS